MLGNQNHAKTFLSPQRGLEHLCDVVRALFFAQKAKGLGDVSFKRNKVCEQLESVPIVNLYDGVLH